MIKKSLSRLIDWFLYTVLSEKQKEKLTNLFSEKQKEKIRKITGFGKRNAQIKLVDHIIKHLYSKGFTKRAYDELVHLLSKYEKDAFMMRLLHWELALWHANQITKKDAEKALNHLQYAKSGEKDTDQLRRIAIIEAECFLLLKNPEKAKAVLEDRLKEQVHPDLYFALANTEENLPDRLHWMNKVYAHYGLTEITFESLSNETTYDCLRTKPITKRIKEGPKVSVILPAYNAEDGIHLAIESILEQTYQNIELIIVEDHSTDDTLNIVKQYAKKDARIKWAQTPENSGPYIARNIGLTLATGEFVTVNDSDDWSHAEKIEIQATHLINNPKIIANTSEHARLTEELTLYRRGTPGRYIFSNMSSLMFRRAIVMEKLGFWDSVRFAADGEFKRRLIRQFGHQRIVDLPSGPLSLPRQSVTSLTGSSAFGYNGFFMGARKEYVESFQHYHEQADSLYYPYPLEKRLFPVPNPMRPKRREVHYDVIVATDFRVLTEDEKHELKALCETKGQIGFVELYKYDLNLAEEMPKDVRDFIDGEKVQRVVYGEHVETEQFLLINHHSILEEQRYIPEVSAENVYLIINDEATGAELDQALAQMKHYLKGEIGLYTTVPLDETLIKEKNIKRTNQLIGSLRHDG